MLRMKRGEKEAFPLEGSSGSESGWTMYLENQSFGRKPSSLSSKQAGFPSHDDRIFEEVEEEEEEDLSMVSDASSGPPHLHDDDDCFEENGCFCSASYSSYAALVKKNCKRKRVATLQAEEKQELQQPSLLDDTASSHVFSFSKSFTVNNNKQAPMEDVLEFSIGFSATHFKKQYGFLQTPAKPDCREEGRNEIF